MPYYYHTSRTGGLLMLLLLALIAIAAIGFWRGWWGMDVAATDHGQQEQVTFDVTVDKQRMNEDKNQVIDEAQQLAEGAKTAAETRTVEGKIKQLGDDREHLVVHTDDNVDVEFVINEASEITSAEDQSEKAADLDVGDPVTVVYRESNGVNTAMKIKVQSQAS